MPEPCGGGVDHSSDLGAAVAGTGAGFSPVNPALAATRVRLATVAARYSWNRVFGTAGVAGLADSQLDQPRQPVLHHHAALPVLGKGLALLQGAGLL